MTAFLQKLSFKHISKDLTKVCSSLRSQPYFQNAQSEELLFNACWRAQFEARYKVQKFRGQSSRCPIFSIEQYIIRSYLNLNQHSLMIFLNRCHHDQWQNCVFTLESFLTVLEEQSRRNSYQSNVVDAQLLFKMDRL